MFHLNYCHSIQNMKSNIAAFSIFSVPLEESVGQRGQTVPSADNFSKSVYRKLRNWKHC